MTRDSLPERLRVEADRMNEGLKSRERNPPMLLLDAANALEAAGREPGGDMNREALAQYSETRERERYEHWMLHVAKCITGSDDPYPAGLDRDWWRVWKAAITYEIDIATAAHARHIAAAIRRLKGEA